MQLTFTRSMNGSVHRALFLLLFLFHYCAKAQVSLVKQVKIGTPLYAVNGKILFAGDSLDSDVYQLWMSDGTSAGTHFLKSFSGVPGQKGYMINSDGVGWRRYDPIVFNNNLYFFAFTYEYRTNGTVYGGYNLWKSDGTAAGTVSLHQFMDQWPAYPTFSTGFPSFCIFNNALYFGCGNNEGTGVNLWKTDGVAVTKVVNIASNGIDGWGPSFLTAFNNALYFVADDGVHGAEIWQSDGTAAGTKMLSDFFPGADGVMNAGYGSGINPRFTVSGNYLYFIGWKNSSYNFFTAWRTDGSAAGTLQLQPTIYAYDAQTYLNPFQVDVNGHFFYTGYEGGTNSDDVSGICSTNGTPAGNAVLVTNNKIKANGIFTSFQNKLFFDGLQGPTGQVSGLFSSDGTTGGTSLVYSFPYAGSYAQSQDFVTAGNSLFFRELFKVSPAAMSWRMVQTGGTAASTKINYGAVALGAPLLMNGRLYFWGNDTASAYFSTTGLYSVLPAPDNASLPVTLTAFNVVLNNQRQAVVHWETANEINNKSFIVERSSNGQTFTSVQVIAGAGSSTQSHQYNWTDGAPLAGDSYYRLKQTDINDQFVYSAVKKISNAATALALFLSPNPVSGNTITLQSGNLSGPVLVEIADITGRVVSSRKFNTYSTSITCDIHSLHAGIYFLKVISNQQLAGSFRFVKQ